MDPKLMFVLVVLSVFLNGALVTSDGCVPKTGKESFVCVCTSSSCDKIPEYEPLPNTHYTVFTSSKAADRLTKRVYDVADHSNISVPGSGIRLRVDTNIRRQSVTGFGGAFTDAASMNFFNLSAGARELLIKSYYSTDGIEYTIGRIPIASCDFSTHPYSYDDYAGDLSLSNFSLAMEDVQYKIPMIQSAIQHSSRPVKFFGSPWSAPGWMKTNGKMNGRGHLIGKPGEKYYKAWAQYFVKFVQEYAKQNVSLWGLTLQNEPSDGEIPDFPFQAMHMSAEMEREFTKLDLGPALEAAGLGHVKLMILDDQTLFLPEFPLEVLKDAEASKYIAGIAVHWYLDRYLPRHLERLAEAHELFSDHFLLYTEACYDGNFVGPTVELGSWTRGEGYSKSIISVMNNWVTGWTDWNLALNMKGGPNWVSNYVDSPIIVDWENDEFYKQPMYYHLGHFSKFISPGSVHVALFEEHELPFESVSNIAFSLPDGSVAVIVLNTEDRPRHVSIHDPGVGYMNAEIPARAIQTYMWKP